MSRRWSRRSTRARSPAPRSTSSSKSRRRPTIRCSSSTTSIATPHLGAATDEAQVQVAVDIAQQIVDFLIDGTIRHAVNIPALSPQGTGSARTASDARREARAPRRAAHQRGAERRSRSASAARPRISKPSRSPRRCSRDCSSGFLDQEFNYVNAPVHRARARHQRHRDPLARDHRLRQHAHADACARRAARMKSPAR